MVMAWRSFPPLVKNPGMVNLSSRFRYSDPICWTGEEDYVPFTLVISLSVMIFNVAGQHVPERSFPQ